MKFLFDEGIPLRLRTYLEDNSHDVTTVGVEHPNALTDETVLEIANREHRILITNDRDYSELIVNQKKSHHGVIYFRLRYVPLETRIAYLQRVLRDYSDQLDQLIVISRGGAIRVHRTASD